MSRPLNHASQRKPELTLLNVFFCFLVVLIHVLSHPVAVLDKTGPLYFLVYVPQRLSFTVVPGFFLLSGVKLFLSENSPPGKVTAGFYGQYYWKRVKSILLPYLIAVLIYYAYFIAAGSFSFSLPALLGYMLRGDIVQPLYFVINLCQLILLYPFWRLILRYSPIITLPVFLSLQWMFTAYLPEILAPLFPSGLPVSTGTLFPSFAFFYLAGCYIGRYYHKFCQLLEENKVFIWVAAVLFLLANAVLSLLSVSGRMDVPYLQFVHILSLLCAIPALFWAAIRLSRHPIPRAVARLDRASYLIYLYHPLALTLFDALARRAGIVREVIRLPLCALFVYITTIGGCLLWQSAAAAVRARSFH